jgi:hypothetical protein
MARSPLADAGTAPNTPSPADSANLQIDLPARTTSPGGGPSATDGYVRVAAQGVYSSPSSTLDFHLFLFVSDDAGTDTGQLLDQRRHRAHLTSAAMRR